MKWRKETFCESAYSSGAWRLVRTHGHHRRNPVSHRHDKWVVMRGTDRIATCYSLMGSKAVAQSLDEDAETVVGVNLTVPIMCWPDKSA
jgi:hypothetical protein